MNWFLKRKLETMGRQGNPSPVFVRSLEKRLRMEIGHPIWWIRWSKVATASLSIVILAGSGTGVYAYSSDEVLPDHPLYIVRQEIEQVEEHAAFTPKMKQRVREHLQRRREHEQMLIEARRQRKDDRLKANEDRKLDRKKRNEDQAENTPEVRSENSDSITER